MNKPQPKPRRNSELARIHILKDELNMSEVQYRDMLQAVTGHRSAGKLDQFARSRVLAHMHELKKSYKNGGKRVYYEGGRRQGKTVNYPGRPHNCDDHPQLKKIEALLTVNGLPWEYVNSMAKSMYKKDNIAFCNSKQWTGIITALIKEFGDDHGK